MGSLLGQQSQSMRSGSTWAQPASLRGGHWFSLAKLSLTSSIWFER